MKFSHLSWAFLPFSIACSTEAVPLGEIDQAATGPGSGSSTASWEAPTCAEPSGEVHEYTSIADTAAQISGAWFLCSGNVSSPADTAGIELSDREAHFLVASGSGLARGATPQHERSVSFPEISPRAPGNYQIDLSSASGVNMYFSRSSADGRFLELNEATSGRRARYVRANPAAPTCTTPTGSLHAFTSIEDVRAKTAGTWRICSGGITSPADTKGLELAGDRAWFLVDTGTGVARQDSWDYERGVAILDTSPTNGPASYQMNLTTGVGTNMYHARVSEDGAKLELDEATSGKKAVYIRVAP
jgi:hypothetical protein